MFAPTVVYVVPVVLLLVAMALLSAFMWRRDTAHLRGRRRRVARQVFQSERMKNV
jgi:hypothetical protein